VETGSTHELVLTRLWYLIGKWEGSGRGPDFRFRARAAYEWTLNDHFLTGQMEITDFGSGQVLSVERCYLYYDYDLGCLVCDTFCQDGMVDHALGHADAQGRMVLTTDRLNCLPRGMTLRRLRRTFWNTSSSQWAFTIETNSGLDWSLYLEGQMRRRA